MSLAEDLEGLSSLRQHCRQTGYRDVEIPRAVWEGFKTAVDAKQLIYDKSSGWLTLLFNNGARYECSLRELVERNYSLIDHGTDSNLCQH